MIDPLDGVAENEEPTRLDKVRDLVPEAFLEGHLDPQRLADAVGIEVEHGPERYGLTWSGRLEAVRALQVQSVASLRPSDTGHEFDSAPNLLITGDSLEVLRLMQRGYNDAIKLIYLDPPYNTTKDFVYNDDFTDGLGTYLKYTGQVDAEGLMVSATAETTGRRHSGWLSLMYPRLALARNLMRMDGLIFVSIDDNEVHNLRHVMDEVFGPQNWLATLVWNRGHSQQQGIFKEYHEYVLAYARDARKVTVFRDPEGGDVIGGALKRVSRANPESEFTFPPGVRCDAADETEFTGTWGEAEQVRLVSGRFLVRNGVTQDEMTLAAGWTQKEQMRALFAGETPVFDTRGQEVAEFFFNASGKLKYRKARTAFTPPTVQAWGTQGAASKALDDLIGAGMFDRPKPVGMIQDMIAWTTAADDIVLDFFAGSGTTAHAVMKQNVKDEQTRRFILVNLPEPTSEGSPARDAGFATIADVMRHRVDAAADSLHIGPIPYRVLELTKSNFRIWDTGQVPTEGDALGETLRLFAQNLDADAPDDAVALELLTKEGIRLDTPWTRLDGEPGPIVVAGEVAICLARESSAELVGRLSGLDVAKVVALDTAFAGRDTDKANLALALRDAGRQLRTF